MVGEEVNKEEEAGDNRNSKEAAVGASPSKEEGDGEDSKVEAAAGEVNREAVAGVSRSSKEAEDGVARAAAAGDGQQQHRHNTLEHLHMTEIRPGWC